MKMPLCLACLMASGFFALSATSRAAPPGGGFHGGFVGHGSRPVFSQSRGISRGGFQGSFVRQNSGAAFSMGGSVGGGPHVSMEHRFGHEFAFRDNDRFFDRDHRFFFFEHHRRRSFSNFAFVPFGYAWCNPCYSSYPYDYSYYDSGDNEPAYDYQYWSDSSAVVQPEPARRGNYHGPSDGLNSSGNAESPEPSYSVGYVHSSYASATVGGQQENPKHTSNEPTVPRDDPSALISPAAPQAPASIFDKLVLVSWLNDAGKDVIFVQDKETNDVQKITTEPNKDNFRIVEVHPNPDPKMFEVVIANGSDQGPVKFRFETPVVMKASTN